MSEFIIGKEYLVNIFLKDGLLIKDIVLSGKDLETGIENIKKYNPTFKKIIVYDNETKDAVKIIRA